jgi:uncharacterized protein (AIM24 family)
MNVRKRQVLAQLQGNTIKMQAGALQWQCGSISSETGLGSGAKAVGGFLKNMVKGFVTGESAVKPLYTGYGFVMLEPTYKYIIIEDISQWGPGGIVLQDGLFLACDATLQEKVVSRKTLSSLVAGEGLFNLSLTGNGVAVFESPVPREELIEIELNNSELKIDGNMAIAWSNTLELTVERSSKSLVGSMVNGEGLLNVYRGSGKVWMAPTVPGTLMDDGEAPTAENTSGGGASKSIIGGDVYEFSAEKFTGVYEILYDNYFGPSDFELNLTNYEIRGGNFRLVVVHNDEIVAELEPDMFVDYLLEDVTGTVSLRIAGESASFKFYIDDIDYEMHSHND